MLNRILVKISNEKEVDYMAKYAKVIRENYSDAEIVGMFLHSSVEEKVYNEFKGVGDDYEVKKVKDEYAKDVKEEKAQEEKIKEKFLSLVENSEFYSKLGETSELLDELRVFDLAIVSNTGQLDHDLKDLLNKHQKPIILVPELEEYSLEKIMVADDQSLESNRSLFNFMEIFDKTKEFKAVTVDAAKEDIKDLNIYLEKIGKKMEYEFETGAADEVILKKSEDHDMVIMGNLKHSFLLEKIAGKSGVKIIEEVKKPIFIG